VGADSFRITGARVVGRHGFLHIEELDLSAGTETYSRLAIRHPGAVAVVAQVDGTVLLIDQYRAPVARSLLEIPAGKLDVTGEPPEVTAGRELEEEAGYRAGRLEHIFDFYTAPGFTDEHMHLFAAYDLVPVAATPHGPEERAAEIVRVPVGEVPALLGSGRVRDAKTLIGLQWLVSQRV
jgi:ADP-ribose pyrophosphatase